MIRSFSLLLLYRVQSSGQIGSGPTKVSETTEEDSPLLFDPVAEINNFSGVQRTVEEGPVWLLITLIGWVNASHASREAKSEAKKRSNEILGSGPMSDKDYGMF